MLAGRNTADEKLREEIGRKTPEWGISAVPLESRDVAIPAQLHDAMSLPVARISRCGVTSDEDLRCAKRFEGRIDGDPTEFIPHRELGSRKARSRPNPGATIFAPPISTMRIRSAASPAPCSTSRSRSSSANPMPVKPAPTTAVATSLCVLLPGDVQNTLNRQTEFIELRILTNISLSHLPTPVNL